MHKEVQGNEINSFPYLSINLKVAALPVTAYIGINKTSIGFFIYDKTTILFYK